MKKSIYILVLIVLAVLLHTPPDAGVFPAAGLPPKSASVACPEDITIPLAIPIEFPEVNAPICWLLPVNEILPTTTPQPTKTLLIK